MFGDIVKFATRAGATIAIISVLLIPFVAITIPNVDYTFFSTIVGKGYALMAHWVPGFTIIYPFATGIITAWLAIKSAQLAVFVSKIVLKIFI